MEFVVTGDGSKTLYNSEIGEHYHSKHGALQESEHVFLKSGLQFFLDKENVNSVKVLEIGFGTGLNFLVTANYTDKRFIMLDYCGIEAYPLTTAVISQTGYEKFTDPDLWRTFINKYQDFLKQPVQITPRVNLEVVHSKVMEFDFDKKFDLVYFDAFAAIHQPDMWSEETLSHVCSFLRPGGVFVTYAITGNLKRSMRNLGFSIEKVPGAPGKREMLRAIKL